MNIFTILSLIGGLVLFLYGMDLMGDSLKKLAGGKLESILARLTDTRWKGFLLGLVVTAVIQSSSASVGVLQALSLSCVIPYSAAVPVILGQNIGTTITPIISALTGNTDSKRVAFTCLYIKMIGVIIVAGIFYALNSAIGFDFMIQQAGAFEIAVIHTLFNILSTVILIPFCNLFEKLAIKTIKSKKVEVEEEKDVFAMLDGRFLAMPSFAVEKCKVLVCDMAYIASDSLKKATALLENYNEEDFLEVDRLESRVDKYEDKTSSYLVKIAQSQMSSKDSKIVTELLHCVGDIERISDHALNIAEAAKEVYDKKLTFSDEAKKDIVTITAATQEILDLAVTALVNDDIAIAKTVEPLEQVIDILKRKIKNGHIARLCQGECTMELGFVLSDILTDFERISDHCSNIAVCFIEIANGSFDTHEYLSQVKAGAKTSTKCLKGTSRNTALNSFIVYFKTATGV